MVRSPGEEAATFYVSIFKNSKITSIARYTKAGQDVTDAYRDR